jgi:hypothetical protein
MHSFFLQSVIFHYLEDLFSLPKTVSLKIIQNSSLKKIFPPYNIITIILRMIVHHTPNIPLSQILFTHHKQKTPLETPSHLSFNNNMIFWKWLQNCQVECICSSSIQLYTFLTTVINFQFHNNEETLHQLKNCDLCKILHPHSCHFISNQIFLTNTHEVILHISYFTKTCNNKHTYQSQNPPLVP